MYRLLRDALGGTEQPGVDRGDALLGDEALCWGARPSVFTAIAACAVGAMVSCRVTVLPVLS